MTMPKAVCPVCKETFHGWILEHIDKLPCPYCGAPLKKGDAENDSLSGTPDNTPKR